MFSYGDKQWPGISKLAEESGEVIQVIGKLLQTRGEVQHWDGSNLRYRLIEELADLQAACRVFEELNLSPDELKFLKDRQLEKTRQFFSWHEDLCEKEQTKST